MLLDHLYRPTVPLLFIDIDLACSVFENQGISLITTCLTGECV